jgi:hypothetical protein
MNKDIEKLIKLLQSQNYSFTQTEDEIIVELKKFASAVINKKDPAKNILIKFGKVKMQTAFALSMPCYVFMLYISFHSVVGLLILSLTLAAIYWDFSRYRESIRFKNLVEDIFNSKV